MDKIRFALFGALGVLCFLMFQAWQADYSTQASTATQSMSTATQGDVPQASLADGDSAKDSNIAHSKTVHIVTDLLDLELDTHGGDIRSAKLLDVKKAADSDDPVHLINDELARFFIVQSGLTGGDAPDHNANYQVEQTEYKLADGQDELVVPLTWTDDKGHQVTKKYTFYRGSHEISLTHEVANNSDSDWKVSQYVRFWRQPVSSVSSIPFSSPFIGVGWYQADADKKGKFSYKKRKHSKLDDDPLKHTQQGGWVAMVQHYFVGAVIPPADVDVRFFAQPKHLQANDEAFDAGFISAGQTIAAGEQKDLTSQLYLGAKKHKDLIAAAKGLDLTIDYGWLTVVAKPIFWVLEKLHGLVGNWGVAIILLTLLIKAAFYKLSEKQYRAMARMRKFAPRMKQLKEQYGDDRETLQAKTMELYRSEGFNPLAGCWPMLVQMPVFIALYWVLRGSVELRLADFLWLQDLTMPDPYYILPAVFGIAMLAQQYLQTNVTMDPMQQKMMRIMPIGMAIFFAFFPAGLVLYYSFNSVLSIAQQWYIYRKLDAEGIGHKASTAKE